MLMKCAVLNCLATGQVFVLHHTGQRILAVMWLIDFLHNALELEYYRLKSLARLEHHFSLNAQTGASLWSKCSDWGITLA